jgi:hypothetical protein
MGKLCSVLESVVIGSAVSWFAVSAYAVLIGL